ncbi:hypothetical protein HNP84_000724 [Thermocatellispora tengchongensis]|uniref:Metalloprotease n=1 Tax=Thermocatellispora tengchongensis TaxID=1073253 RepID=A0A840NTX1_9ACTN|nr:neutral zinc metallopeptidase [Thermocatellispora tengchongensis]MBB5131018.1 hypothetical protein [Thermocatellispora tengchongensis]
MRIPLIALASSVLACVLLAGTAGASAAAAGAASGPVPKGTAALTKNPIYKTGKLELKECDEQPVKPEDADSARIYLEYVLDCLDESWSAQFAKAKLPFAKPKFKVLTTYGKTTCGTFPTFAQGLYCENSRTIYVLLDKAILSEPGELFLFQLLAHEYGHHVQELAGILDEEVRLQKKKVPGVWERHRRVELQAECLSGAFIGSVWQSLGRSQFDFDYIGKLAQAGFDSKSHGKGKNIAYWLKRGFDAESPDACNTWTAPKSRVA